ncbi:MAG: DNA mismatch repair protein, partial [Bacteroidetes bacterium]|nr:DNA mismatch repair protein [Bacteroidota bacterium]
MIGGNKSRLLIMLKIKNKTLKEVCGQDLINKNYSNKGSFGQLLEEFYFEYKPNSVAEADFAEVGLELKASPLKLLSNSEYRSKERLVLNIISYLDVAKEDFETSSFWKKNANLLLIFYLYEQNKDLLEFEIKLIEEWSFNET